MTHMVSDSPVVGKLSVRRMGSELQPILKKKGDDLRIDWGWFYMATPWNVAAASRGTARTAFAKDGRIPQEEKRNSPDG